MAVWGGKQGRLITSTLSPHPQAYGARDYKALGEVLQRALLVCWVACIPVALLWSQSTALMVAVGQDPAIAAMAGRCGGGGSMGLRSLSASFNPKT